MATDRNNPQKLAQKLLATGKVPQAIEELLKVLREHPGDWGLMMQIGELYLQIGQSAKAIPLLQRVAEHHCAEGFLLKAIAIYKRMERLNPNSVETRVQLADLYFRQGLIPEARFEILAAVDYCEQRRQSREAMRLYHKLLDLTPDDAVVRADLARLYEREGMIPEAVGQYLELSGRWARKGRHDEELAALEKARRLNPRNAAVLWKMLWIYLEQEEFGKASHLLEEFTAVNPSDPEMLGLIVKTFSHPAQLAQMIDLVDRALAATAVREPLLVLKGELFLRLGNTEAAYMEFVSAMEGMLSCGEHTRAIALTRRITRQNHTFHPAWELLVDLYIQEGLDSHLPDAYAALADAYIAHSMYADAKKCLEKLMELDPRNRVYRDKLEYVHSVLPGMEPWHEERGTKDGGEFDLEITLDAEGSEGRDEPEGESSPAAARADSKESGDM